MDSDPGSRQALIHRFVAQRAHHLGFLRLLCRDRELAEDLFQDLSVAVIESLDRFDRGQDFERWVRGIARNLHRKRLTRLATRRDTLSADDRLDDLVAAAYDAAPASDDLGERLAGLRRCLDALDGRGRELVAARYARGEASAAIAAQRRTTVAAIDTALCRLRAALHDCVRQRLRRGWA